MSNNFGAFAAIITDIAGTEHGVWEHQGALRYTSFDRTANQCSNAEPASDASGGSVLKRDGTRASSCYALTRVAAAIFLFLRKFCHLGSPKSENSVSVMNAQ
ncbi:MAG: hypothetical protein AAGG02_17700 [Cyanobacteria bacterium P01_H01_bin.15]